MLNAFQSAVCTLCSFAVGTLLQTSCTVITPPDDGDNGDVTPPAQVILRIVNLSAFGVDPQVYASAEPLGDPETTIFAPANLQVVPINFGTGIVPPGQSGEIPLECTAAVTVGTRGGRFINQDASQAGTGQQRIASIDQVYSCGDRVTFTYRQEGSAFTTAVSVD